jgi:hypothetical protein
LQDGLCQYTPSTPHTRPLEEPNYETDGTISQQLWTQFNNSLLYQPWSSAGALTTSSEPLPSSTGPEEPFLTATSQLSAHTPISFSSQSFPTDEPTDEPTGPWDVSDAFQSDQSFLPTPSTPILESAPRFGTLPPRPKLRNELQSSTTIFRPYSLPIEMLRPLNPYLHFGPEDNPAKRIKVKPDMTTPQECALTHSKVSIGPSLESNIGPYRKAAMWEFIGQTFAKPERRFRKKSSRRFKVGSQCMDNRAPPSKLSFEIKLQEKETEFGRENYAYFIDD